MNIQAMMQQAQKMQKEVVAAKKEIENQKFIGSSSLVEVEVTGKKEVVRVTIKKDIELTVEDLEVLEDMVMIAVNEALENAEKAMNDKMGKINPSLNGLI